MSEREPNARLTTSSRRYFTTQERHRRCSFLYKRGMIFILVIFDCGAEPSPASRTKLVEARSRWLRKADAAIRRSIPQRQPKSRREDVRSGVRRGNISLSP